MEVLLGVILVAASALAFYVALPRGGQVVKFLRNDNFQSCYAALVIGLLVTGALMIAAGLTPLGTDTDFQ
jgi:hypothetical protein